MRRLRLEVRDSAGPLWLRWLLSEEGTGEPLADHLADLGGAPGEFAAFTDLYRYMRWNAVPDRRISSEADIAARVGTWAGEVVLGRAVCDAIVAAAPVTVRVLVPERAAFVLSWPLELAYAGGRPLAARGDVTLAYELVPDLQGGPVEVVDAVLGSRGLRMLAVFSLPTATSVLALRRERYELVRLVRRIRARQRRQVELAVVQYGATRERLESVAEAGDGWDVLHLSGHGGRGQFLLERPDGSPDPVDTAELLRLLAPLRGQVRLAVVSACESAAATTAETLRWVGLDAQAEQFEQQAEQEMAAPNTGGAEEPPLTGVARAVAAQMGCAVVAMRYPVADDFAVGFAQELYERLLGVRDTLPGSRGQPLGVALARAVAKASGPEPSPVRPVLSLATPMLIGRPAPGLVLEVPRSQPGLDLAQVRMQGFPDEPERFVGRAQAMAEAGAALAEGSGLAGVLLHGMPRAGKTACALELAYRHQDSFAAGAAFWRAPHEKDQFGEALASLAAHLDVQLHKFKFSMSDKIATPETLARFAPELRRLLEGDVGVLLVLDGLETLLTPAGTWRDRRWEPLMAALTGHRGESRVILTSCIPPAGLGDSVLVLPVHTLDLAESAGLARELPGLRGLLHAEVGPFRADEAAADRDQVRRVLDMVQGHPELMELAGKTVTRTGPDQLSAQLDAAQAAEDGQVLTEFFRTSATAADAAKCLDALAAWAVTTSERLSAPARLMAQFVACLDNDERHSLIIDAAWGGLWHRLSQPGGPPDPAPLLAAVTAAGLIRPESSTVQPGSYPGTGLDISSFTRYWIHPGVSHPLSASAPDVQTATDAEIGSAYWQSYAQAVQQEGSEAGWAIVPAALRAAAYLIRLQDWDAARDLLDQVLTRNDSPSVIQRALPALRAIAGATPTRKALVTLARALASIDPAEAEAIFRASLAQAVTDDNFMDADIIASNLVNLLIASGRLPEARDLADQAVHYTHLAGLGPWSHLANQALRLRILRLMGQHREVLDQIPVLQEQMADLPQTRASNDTAVPWSVRENIIGIGRGSADALGEWQQRQDLNIALVASMRARGASASEMIGARSDEARTLIELGRWAEAERILDEAQQFYENQNDVSGLEHVLSTRANLEMRRSHEHQALELKRAAIRLAYTVSKFDGITAGHYEIANYLRAAGGDLATARAHRLAAALLYKLADMNDDLTDSVTELARELRRDGEREDLPGTLEKVIRLSEQTEGVHLDQLITALQPDRQAASDALADILRTAADTDTGQISAIRDYLRQMEPIIAAAASAASEDSEAIARLTMVGEHLVQNQDWNALATWLGHVMGVDREDSPLHGLDLLDPAFGDQLLARLAQKLTADAGGSMTSIADAIAELTSEKAIRVLADTADYQDRLPDPAQLRALEDGLRQAITDDTELAGFAEPSITADAGDLAKATLMHLAATRPDLLLIITRAIDDPGYPARDPVTLTVGALVILALQSEVKVSRNTQGRWTFTLHKHPMRDSTLGQVISKLLSYISRGR
jgi:tetratricopeptide (TPR) repeat protein